MVKANVKMNLCNNVMRKTYMGKYGTAEKDCKNVCTQNLLIVSKIQK